MTDDLLGITSLTLRGVNDINGLEYCINLTELDAQEWSESGPDYDDQGNLLGYITPVSVNAISDIRPLVDNPGMGTGDSVDLGGNRLDQTSLLVYVPQLEDRGVEVYVGKLAMPDLISTFTYVPISLEWILENDQNESPGMIMITFPTSWLTSPQDINTLENPIMLPIELIEPYDKDDNPNTITIDKSANWFYSYSKRP